MSMMNHHFFILRLPLYLAKVKKSKWGWEVSFLVTLFLACSKLKFSLSDGTLSDTTGQTNSKLPDLVVTDRLLSVSWSSIFSHYSCWCGYISAVTFSIMSKPFLSSWVSWTPLSTSLNPYLLHHHLEVVQQLIPMMSLGLEQELLVQLMVWSCWW